MEEKLLADGVSIVSFIGEHLTRSVYRYGEKSGNGAVVGCFAACQDKAKRASLTVHAGMDFCRKAAA